jgi:hypothetical protein
MLRSRFISLQIDSRSPGVMARESRFDQTPAGRKIGVIGRQGPKAMSMIGEYDDGLDPERPLSSHGTKGFA